MKSPTSLLKSSKSTEAAAIPDTSNPTRKPKNRNILPLEIPIKILIIGGKKQYCKTVWCSAGAGLAHLLIGLTAGIILMYTIGTGDKHAILCTLAYQCLTAEAILCLNQHNGCSIAMRYRHRKCAHVFLQICSVVCVVIGSVMILLEKGVSGKAHSITGIVTVCLGAFSVLSGTPSLFLGQNWKYVHICFGIATFITSTVCFIFALLTPAFDRWAGNVVKYILVGACLYYCLFISISTILKYTTKF